MSVSVCVCVWCVCGVVWGGLTVSVFYCNPGVFFCVFIVSETSAVCSGDPAEKHKNLKTQKPQQYI